MCLPERLVYNFLAAFSKSLLIIYAAFLLLSCSPEELNLQPGDKSLLTESLQDAQDLQILVNGIYRAMYMNVGSNHTCPIQTLPGDARYRWQLPQYEMDYNPYMQVDVQNSY